MPPKVVIIGAGFGGLQCARKLAGQPVEVLLVDRNNYHLFTPLLYQVASSLLDPSDIAYPVRAVFRRAQNVRFRVAEVMGIDPDRRTIRLDQGAEVAFDYLVIAAGSTDSFFGLTSVQQVAHGLKNLPQAIELRTSVVRAFEAAARETDATARAGWLTFAIVGAGPTGVEYAGALTELVHRVLAKDYPELDLTAVRVILIEGLDKVLPAFPAALGENARRELVKIGVEVRLQTRVLDAAADCVRLSSGEELRCRNLIWAAGVKPADLAANAGLPVTRTRRVIVDEYLQVPSHKGVFAIGDIAAAKQNGEELLMMAPQAMQEGRYVGGAILALEGGRSFPAFRYRDKGIMATIGRHAAVAQVKKFKFTGVIGWVVWLTLHLYYIEGYRNRLAVFGSWLWNYIFYDRPIRLLTGKVSGER